MVQIPIVADGARRKDADEAMMAKIAATKWQTGVKSVTVCRPRGDGLWVRNIGTDLSKLSAILKRSSERRRLKSAATRGDCRVRMGSHRYSETNASPRPVGVQHVQVFDSQIRWLPFCHCDNGNYPCAQKKSPLDDDAETSGSPWQTLGQSQRQSNPE
jgi:hypothetical protein